LDAGAGVTRVLSYQVASAIKARTLELVLDKFEAPAAPVSLVYGGGQMQPLKLRAFLDLAVPRLKAGSV
jgi:DNA-binding transcriptional LysR family regulator